MWSITTGSSHSKKLKCVYVILHTQGFLGQESFKHTHPTCIRPADAHGVRARETAVQGSLAQEGFKHTHPLCLRTGDAYVVHILCMIWARFT